MNASENGATWPNALEMRDLIQRFPLPIALLDHEGGPPVWNDDFERTYGPEAFDSAALQELIRQPVPGWRTIQLGARGQGQIRIRVQVLRVRGIVMLVLDSEAEPDLLRKLDEMHLQITDLERLSSIDSLTGAWNRGHFHRVVASELERSIRFKQTVSLVFLDIDHFKQVNDTYGHQAGDSVLIELAHVIGAAVRLSDMLFRWGGEEFVVLAPSTGYRAAARLAERMRRHVEHHRFSGVGPVMISLGVAENIAAESAEIWFHRLDEALYRAKEGGRNRVDVDQRGSSDMWAKERCPSLVHLIWQEAYECGEPTIDRQHRELFELANALFDASFKSETAPDAFSAALEKLLAHIAWHFADEEVLLARHGYKDLEWRCPRHAELLARATELKAAIAAGKTTLGELVEFLANSVVAHHLFTEDRKFFPLFEKPGVRDPIVHSCS